MAEAAQTRVQKAFHQLMTDLDQSCLRKMQGDMHRCAAQCCDQTNYSLEDTQHCITNCSKPINSAQTYVESEVTAFQSRIERCVLNCQDSIRDKIGANTTESQIKGFTEQFETCVVKCVDTHIELIPNLLNKMRDMIKNSSYN